MRLRGEPRRIWQAIERFLGLGNWYVLYPDGERSRPMACRVAQDYAKMFGGTIHRTRKPIFDWGLR